MTNDSKDFGKNIMILPVYLTACMLTIITLNMFLYGILSIILNIVVVVIFSIFFIKKRNFQLINDILAIVPLYFIAYLITIVLLNALISIIFFISSDIFTSNVLIMIFKIIITGVFCTIFIKRLRRQIVSDKLLSIERIIYRSIPYILFSCCILIIVLHFYFLFRIDLIIITFFIIYILLVVLLPLMLFLHRDKLTKTQFIIGVIILMILFITLNFWSINIELLPFPIWFFPVVITILFSGLFIYLYLGRKYLHTKTLKSFRDLNIVYSILLIISILNMWYIIDVVTKLYSGDLLSAIFIGILYPLLPIVIVPGIVYFALCNTIHNIITKSIKIKEGHSDKEEILDVE